MITPAETAAALKALPAVAAAKALPQAEVKLPTQAAVAVSLPTQEAEAVRLPMPEAEAEVKLPMPVAAEAAVSPPEAAKLPAATAHSHSRVKFAFGELNLATPS